MWDEKSKKRTLEKPNEGPRSFGLLNLRKIEEGANSDGMLAGQILSTSLLV
jgi:hypothetical protein